MTESNRTNEELHRALWRWLAETGSMYKGKWPEWTMNGGTVPYVSNLCHACGSVGVTDEGQNDCDKCPVNWGGLSGEKYHCEDYPSSPYALWNGNDDDNPSERKRLAAIIAELPWKEGGWA